jgi:hypothetical protein
MDVERIIDEIEQLQEMFEAPDIRPQRYGVCCRTEFPVLRLGESDS